MIVEYEYIEPVYNYVVDYGVPGSERVVTSIVGVDMLTGDPVILETRIYDPTERPRGLRVCRDDSCRICR